MAAEEDLRPQPLPPYPELILAAIAADDENGASVSSISDFVGSSLGRSLPPSHAALLSSHLARMAEAGELLLVGGSYFRPGPDALPPPKRGRGRPPKPRHPVTGDSAPRRRGRPPKPVDPLAPAKVPRPRGRPPKNAPSCVADPDRAALAKRPRGRPPKVRPQFTEVGFV